MKFLVLAIFGQSLATTNSTADCIEAENALTQATHSNVYGLKLSCEVACAGVDGATCADKSYECIIAENTLANEKDALAKMPLALECEAACDGVDGAVCEYKSVDKSAECIDAENALANEQDALAKMPLKLACEAACTGEDGAACGFLVNGVSMILFVLLAMFK